MIQRFLLANILILFVFSVAFAEETCEQILENKVNQFRSACSGTKTCYGYNPTGYFVPTEFTHGVIQDIKIEEKLLKMKCVPTSCPPLLYALDIPPAQTLSLCDFDPYPEVHVAPEAGKCNQKLPGSIVNLDTQSLGESVPLLGVGYSLNYFSHLNKGRGYDALLILTKETPVPNASGFLVKVVSDSIEYVPEFLLPNQPHVSYHFTWDGNDENNNPVWGPKKFDIISTRQSSPLAQSLPLWKTTVLGAFDAKLLGLGGWIPSIYRFYSSSTDRLYGGDGSVRFLTAKKLTNDPQGATYLVGSDDNTEVYYFDSVGRILFTKTSITGQVRYSFNYDSQGRLISIAEPFNRVTQFVRDSQGKLLRIVAPKGVYSSSSSSPVLNTNSLVTLTELDSNGYLSSLKNSEVPGNSYQMTYTSLGLLLTFQKPGAQISTFSYDSNGALIKDSHSGGYFFELIKVIKSEEDYDITTTTSDGKNTVYNVSGQSSGAAKRKVTYPNNIQNETTYSSTDAYTSAPQSYSMKQFSNDSRIQGSSYLFGDVFQEGGYYVRNYRWLTPVVSDSENPFSIITITNRFEIGARMLTSVYDGPTKTYLNTSGEGRTSQLKIDTHERLIFVQQGDLTPTALTYSDENLTKISQGSREVNFTYNSNTGFLQSITNSIGQSVVFSYDALGRISQKLTSDSRVVKFFYDNNGNLTELVTPKNISHLFNFNASELMSAYIAPVLSGGGPTGISYEYTLDKELKKVTQPNGDVITFDIQGNTGVLRKVTTVQGDYNIVMDPTNGKVSTITTPTGLKSRFTHAGPTLSMDEVLNSQNQKLYHYAQNFYYTNRSGDEITGSVGQSSYISYTRDTDDNVTKAGDISLTYNQNNLLASTSFGEDPDKITDLYTYNNFGEVLTYTANRGNNPIYSYSLSRDSLGRVISKSETVGDKTRSYDVVYDSTGRVEQVKRGSTILSSYQYDLNGNRISGTNGAQNIIATYDDQDRLNSYNLYEFSYDLNGNLYTKTNTLTSSWYGYAYDPFGRLKQVVVNPSKIVSYEIDALGRRASRSVNGVLKERYVYMDGVRITATIDPSGNIAKRFVYASKFNVPDYMIMGTEKYRLISDNLGSVRLVVRLSDGAVVQRLDYDVFGNVLLDSNTCFQPFGFAGGLRDVDTRLVHFGARDYDPEIGRWTSKDPILFAGGDTNLYGYVQNDPVNWVDPDGFQKRLVFRDGVLSLYNDNGSKMGSWNATSGSRTLRPSPPGLYAVGNFRDNRTTKGMVCPGSDTGYSLNIEPMMSTVGNRSLLRIHPDQPPRGTEGCIGISCRDGAANDFGNIMREIFNQPMSPDIILEVQ